jgi:hypothetical protein
MLLLRLEGAYSAGCRHLVEWRFRRRVLGVLEAWYWGTIGWRSSEIFFAQSAVGGGIEDNHGSRLEGRMRNVDELVSLERPFFFFVLAR